MLGAYTGDAGDSLSYHSGMQFSTRDEDNDVSSDHCAQWYRGGWWFQSCHKSDLNGRYYPGGPYTSSQSQTGYNDGVQWSHWKDWWYSLKTTRMMVRPAP